VLRLRGSDGFERRFAHGCAIARRADRIDELRGLDRILRGDRRRLRVEIDRGLDDARHGGECTLHAARAAAAMHAVDGQFDRLQARGREWFSHVGFPKSAVRAANDPSINIPMMGRSRG
jgi:hypothetical protein